MSVERTVLREQVKDVLLQRILSSHYSPGERLVETRIAQELGTSQAPVREALRDLESLRFVESAPFRGARVRRPSLDELLEIYPVRAALEETAIRLAAAHMPALEALESELAAMREHAGRGDASGLVTHDAAFHRLIVAAAGNGTLLRVWESLGIHEHTTVTLVAASLSQAEVVDLHVPILEALRTRDGERAAAAIRQHFDLFAQLLQPERKPA